MRMKYKLPALCLIIASVMAIAGNALHPRDAAETKPIAHLTAHLMEHDMTQWYIAHTILLAMVPIMLLGYLGLFQYLQRRQKDNYSLVAFVLIGVWAVLSLFVFTLDGFVGPLFAREAGGMFEYNYYMSLVLTVVSFVVYGPALALFGLSALRDKAMYRWLAYSGIVLGGIGIIGYPLGIFGSYWVYSPIFPAYAALTTLWSLLIGVNLLKLKPTK